MSKGMSQNFKEALFMLYMTYIADAPYESALESRPAEALRSGCADGAKVGLASMHLYKRHPQRFGVPLSCMIQYRFCCLQ